MSLRNSISRVVGLHHVAHRPALTPRFWLYCIAAFVVPVVALLVLPSGPQDFYDELVWLITLVPAFLLSLHYGLRGSLVGLLAGTVLFIAVQVLQALGDQAADWRITVPIYVAYGALATSVGWLSEQLHSHYQAALEKERLAAIGQLAVAIRHEVNNALTTIIAESQLLAEVDQTLGEDQRTSARSIYEAAQRIAGDIRKLTSLTSAPVVEYDRGVQMLDLRAAKGTSQTT